MSGRVGFFSQPDWLAGFPQEEVSSFHEQSDTSTFGRLFLSHHSCYLSLFTRPGFMSLGLISFLLSFPECCASALREWECLIVLKCSILEYGLHSPSVSHALLSAF